MFREHFGLRADPFSLSPNLKFLYMSKALEETMAHLAYGLEQGEDYILITGAIGTGKTLALHNLMAQVSATFQTALINVTQLDYRELLKMIVREVGLTAPVAADRADLLASFKSYLLKIRLEGRKLLLIIDEAQNLTPETLEGVRLLTNLAQPGEQCLQIVLAGQPGLEQKIRRPDLAQLRQRIRIHYCLETLDRQELEKYVLHRLRIAGCDQQLFKSNALDRIFQASGGVPRLVNILGSRALLSAYVSDSKIVEAKHVEVEEDERVSPDLPEVAMEPPKPMFAREDPARPARSEAADQVPPVSAPRARQPSGIAPQTPPQPPRQSQPSQQPQAPMPSRAPRPQPQPPPVPPRQRAPAEKPAAAGETHRRAKGERRLREPDLAPLHRRPRQRRSRKGPLLAAAAMSIVILALFVAWPYLSGSGGYNLPSPPWSLKLVGQAPIDSTSPAGNRQSSDRELSTLLEDLGDSAVTSDPGSEAQAAEAAEAGVPPPETQVGETGSLLNRPDASVAERESGDASPVPHTGTASNVSSREEPSPEPATRNVTPATDAAVAKPATAEAGVARDRPDDARPVTAHDLPPPPSPSIGYGVHVGSFGDLSRAEAFIARLNEKGFPAFFVRKVIGGETWNRVYVGPYLQREQAQRSSTNLQELDLADYYFVTKFGDG